MSPIYRIDFKDVIKLTMPVTSGRVKSLAIGRSPGGYFVRLGNITTCKFKYAIWIPGNDGKLSLARVCARARARPRANARGFSNVPLSETLVRACLSSCCEKRDGDVAGMIISDGKSRL